MAGAASVSVTDSFDNCRKGGVAERLFCCDIANKETAQKKWMSFMP